MAVRGLKSQNEPLVDLNRLPAQDSLNWNHQGGPGGQSDAKKSAEKDAFLGLQSTVQCSAVSVNILVLITRSHKTSVSM